MFGALLPFILLLCAAVLFGGGGRGAPIANLVVQLAAFSVLFFAYRHVRYFFCAAPRPLIALIGLSLLLPLVQLVPLSPVIWGALPGREMLAQSLALIGEPVAWAPISLMPNLTLLALVGLVAPLTILILGFSLTSRARSAAVSALMVLALITFLIASVQLVSGGVALNFYGSKGQRLVGLFANPNSAGLFFVIILGAFLFSSLPERLTAFTPMIRSVGALLMVLGVVLSQSRSSIALMIVPLVFLLLRTAMPMIASAQKRAGAGGWFFVIGVSIFISGAGYVVAQNDKLNESFERFGHMQDARTEIWSDGLVAAKRYWPVGAGMGTFDEVFQIDESLELVTPKRAGRAHNDYLEIAVESGVVGPMLLALWVIYFVTLTWRKHRVAAGGPDLAAVSGLIVIAAQSFVDYPLRSQALLCVFAMLIVLLHEPKTGDGKVIDVV